MDQIYAAFHRYFAQPVLHKIRDLEGNLSLYTVHIHSLIGGGKYRYIIAIVPADPYPPGTSRELGQLRWVCLQTRSIGENYDTPYHKYTPTRQTPLHVQITKNESKSDEETTVYDCASIPLEISLLPHETGVAYQNTGTITSALETYNTVVVWRLT